MTFAETIAAGGVVVFPADTVYGLACDPENADAVQRLYVLKGRPADKPAAVMFFSVAALPSDRYPLAGGAGTLGLRVPDLPRFAAISLPVLQTSANLSGSPDARRVGDVPASIRQGVVIW